MQIETWCYHQGEERISIIKIWHQEGHPANGNNLVLTIENRSSLPQCGKEGVVLYGLSSRDVKR